MSDKLKILFWGLMGIAIGTGVGLLLSGAVR